MQYKKVALDIGTHITLPLFGRLTPLYAALHSDHAIAMTGSTLQTGRSCQLECKPAIIVVGVRIN